MRTRVTMKVFFFYTIAVRLQNNYCTKAKLAFSTVEHDQFPIER